MSGSALSSWALSDDPSKYASELAEKLNCTVPDDLEMEHESIFNCLRHVPIEDILEIDISTPRFRKRFSPSVDGVTIEPGHRETLITRKDQISMYPTLFGVVGNEALYDFNEGMIHNGIESSERSKILRTYIRNSFLYHLQEIYATIENEYTDWQRPVEHPANIRDATLQALGDAQYVAPLVEVGKQISIGNPKTWFYVFNHISKNSDYPEVSRVKRASIRIIILYSLPPMIDLIN